MAERCLKQAGARVIYITMTRGVAKQNVWSNLKRISDEHELGVEWNNTELSGTFPNGSVIRLTGAETQHDVDKLRGTYFDLVLIDESKSFPAHILDELIEEVIEPLLYDRYGTLVLMGTPGAILAGTFYEATSDKGTAIRTLADGRRVATARPYTKREEPAWQGVEFRWSSHTWTTADNVALPHIWENVLADHRAKGQSDDDPRWCREYLGRWIADDTAFVYRYSADRNGYEPARTEGNPWGLPEGHEWRFVAGVDLGYDDDFDIEVAAYADTCETFYHVGGFASPGLTIADIARKIKELDAQFGGFETIVGDSGGLGKQIFKSLEEIYDVHVEAAEKSDKRDHIELLNSDLVSGRCKIIASSNLAAQMSLIQWDENKKREGKEFANHASDAWLYIWRACQHHFSHAKVQAARPGTFEWLREREMREMAEHQERRRRRLRDEQSFDGRALDAVSSEWGGYDA